MIRQKRLPRRRRRLLGSHPILDYGGLGDVDAEFAQLPDNSGRTPADVGCRHLADQ